MKTQLPTGILILSFSFCRCCAHAAARERRWILSNRKWHTWHAQTQEDISRLAKSGREAMTNSPAYSSYSDSLDAAYSFPHEAKDSEAIDSLMAIMAGHLWNPCLHMCLSFVFHNLDKHHDARFELAVATSLLTDILPSGGGSQAHPYVVLYTTDEYDFLEHLGKAPVTQALVEVGDRRFDRQECKDGSQV